MYDNKCDQTYYGDHFTIHINGNALKSEANIMLHCQFNNSIKKQINEIKN